MLYVPTPRIAFSCAVPSAIICAVPNTAAPSQCTAVASQNITCPNVTLVVTGPGAVLVTAAVNVVTVAADLQAGAVGIGLLVGVDSRWLVTPLGLGLVALLLVGKYDAVVAVLRYLLVGFLSFAAAALLAVANGEAQVMMAPILAAMPMVQDGRLRALAVTGRHPAPAVPELPTISGTLPGFSALSWYGILAPAGTPSAVITRLNTELDRIVHEPQIEKRFADIGGEAIGGPPSTLASLIHDEIARWRQVAKEAGIHVE